MIKVTFLTKLNDRFNEYYSWTQFVHWTPSVINIWRNLHNFLHSSQLLANLRNTQLRTRTILSANEIRFIYHVSCLLHNIVVVKSVKTRKNSTSFISRSLLFDASFFASFQRNDKRNVFIAVSFSASHHIWLIVSARNRRCQWKMVVKIERNRSYTNTSIQEREMRKREKCDHF